MENNSLKYRHLTGEEILAYHNQKLSASEMHLIEKHLQECSFCEEAMNGVSKMDNSLRTTNIIRDLRKKGRLKFGKRKKIFELLDFNSLLILLFIIGMLIFLAVYIVRLS